MKCTYNVCMFPESNFCGKSNTLALQPIGQDEVQQCHTTRLMPFLFSDSPFCFSCSFSAAFVLELTLGHLLSLEKQRYDCNSVLS